MSEQLYSAWVDSAAPKKYELLNERLWPVLLTSLNVIGQGGPRSTRNNRAIAIVLGCPPQLDDKTL